MSKIFEGYELQYCELYANLFRECTSILALYGGIRWFSSSSSSSSSCMSHVGLELMIFEAVFFPSATFVWFISEGQLSVIFSMKILGFRSRACLLCHLFYTEIFLLLLPSLHSTALVSFCINSGSSGFLWQVYHVLIESSICSCMVFLSILMFLNPICGSFPQALTHRLT
jgi:hypothetical protein